MISDGHNPEGVGEELLPGAPAILSASGNDVYFATSTSLVPQDDGDVLTNVYDARIDGGFPTPAPEPSCSGEACQGASSGPPSFGSLGTSSFTGGGNLTPGSTSFPPPPTTGKVSIAKHSYRKDILALSVSAPAEGRISAAGSDMATVKRSVSNAGTYTLKLSVTKAGKASLRKHHQLKIKIKVAFTPTSGEASSAAVTITVKT